jgi:TolB protein
MSTHPLPEDRARSCAILVLVLSASLAAAGNGQPAPAAVVNGGLPAVSPDGSRIAFLSNRGGSQDLFVIKDSKDRLAVFVMNADGSGQRQVTRLTPEEGQAQWPVWSPDGRRLAIQVNDSNPQAHACHIWIVDVATGEARKLSAHSQSYLDETPSWFPDGKRIAFQSNRTGRMEVWVMNADGSGQRQVTGL